VNWVLRRRATAKLTHSFLVLLGKGAHLAAMTRISMRAPLYSKSVGLPV